MCEGVGQDSGCGHKESHLMHDIYTFHVGLHFCMDYGMMCVCHCMCI